VIFGISEVPDMRGEGAEVLSMGMSLLPRDAILRRVMSKRWRDA